MAPRRSPPRYRVGQRVRVRAAYPPGHVRTPYYCRGRVGVVERLCGAFANPEEARVQPARTARGAAVSRAVQRLRALAPTIAGIRRRGRDRNLPTLVGAGEIIGAVLSGAHGYYRRLQAAVEELLVLKGIFTVADVDRQVEAMEIAAMNAAPRWSRGAWVDPVYKARMLADGSAAAEELGLEVGSLRLIVVENTATVHNIIVCTLCSCYPRTLLGIPPEWYKSRPYRSRVVREPRAVLAEFGTRARGRRHHTGPRLDRGHALHGASVASRGNRRLDRGPPRDACDSR